MIDNADIAFKFLRQYPDVRAGLGKLDSDISGKAAL
jgi:hypothetical protein